MRGNIAKRLIISLLCVFMISVYNMLNTVTPELESFQENSYLPQNDKRQNTLFVHKRFQNGRQTIEPQSIKEKENGISDKKVAADDKKQIVTVKPKLHGDSVIEIRRHADVITQKPSQPPKADPDLPPFVAWNPENGIGENNKNPSWDPSWLSAHDKKLYDEGYARNSFNQFLSDRISVTRRLPDIRSKHCKSRNYTNLSEASVIIVFRNEAWSTLLRTVQSILNRSPPHLLKEIILVDDDSSYDFLKKPLERYMKKLLKVKILRTGKREGLIRSRILGYSVARGRVLVFLDSHIECFPGWLEPLLDRIYQNPKNVPFPIIERINAETFEISVASSPSTGTFSWRSLLFRWQFDFDQDDQEDAMKSPTMPGGLFAINRDYFTKLGTYDPDLDFWGGENMELSFKVWMCNGSIEVALCSHVGHIYRTTNPNVFPQKAGTNILPMALVNSLRVADVWMDEYKEYVFDQINITKYFKGDKSDVSQRRKLRESLHCKTFDWYMKNVHPKKFVPRDAIYSGDLRSAAFGSTKFCIDSMGEGLKKPELFVCHGEGYNQYWQITEKGQIRQENYFICVNQGELKKGYRECKTNNSHLAWEYTQNQSLRYHESGLCIDATKTPKLVMRNCTNSIYQKWIIKKKHRTLL